MTERSTAIEDGTHVLTLGQSFNQRSQVNFHSIRYDFKPASVDTKQDSVVEVGDGNQVTVTVPHVQSSGISQTVYKGNKRPTQKECVLIIDHETGDITLEQLSNAIQLKKTRLQGVQQTGSGNIARSSTPIDTSSVSKQKTGRASVSSVSSPTRSVESYTPQSMELVMSSSDSDSDADLPSSTTPASARLPDLHRQSPPVPSTAKPKAGISMLSSDLQLSDSSDSD